jgi:hypothetical protein
LDNISARRIQWFFSSKKKSLNDMRGRHVKKTIPEDAKNVIRNHLQSFQTMPSIIVGRPQTENI